MKIKKVDSIEGHQGALRFSDLSAGDSFRWVCNPNYLCIKVADFYGGPDSYVSLGRGVGTHCTSEDSNNIRDNREVKEVMSEIHYI